MLSMRSANKHQQLETYLYKTSVCVCVPGVLLSRRCVGRWRTSRRLCCKASPSLCPPCARWRSGGAARWARTAAATGSASAVTLAHFPPRSRSGAVDGAWPCHPLCRFHLCVHCHITDTVWWQQLMSCRTNKRYLVKVYVVIFLRLSKIKY